MPLSQAQKDALKARRQAQDVSQDVSRETPPPADGQELQDFLAKQFDDVQRQNVLEEQLQQIEQESIQEGYQDIDDVPWEPAQSNGVSSMMAPLQPMQIVRGFSTEGKTAEQLEDMSEMIHSYIGVIPRSIDSYTGRWLIVVGCAVMPVEADVNRVNRQTGEILRQHAVWDTPLFKLATVDPDTGMNIVLAGGGRYGLQFAMEMTSLFGPGDWRKPREMFISQEGRRGIDENGQEAPRRMYRFNHRRLSSR